MLVRGIFTRLQQYNEMKIEIGAKGFRIAQQPSSPARATVFAETSLCQRDFRLRNSVR